MINLSVTACSFHLRRSYSKSDVVYSLNKKIDYFDKEKIKNVISLLKIFLLIFSIVLIIM